MCASKSAEGKSRTKILIIYKVLDISKTIPYQIYGQNDMFWSILNVVFVR